MENKEDLKLEILCHHTSNIVHCFSFSSMNIESLIKQKDTFKIYISGAVEFGYTLWLLLDQSLLFSWLLQPPEQ